MVTVVAPGYAIWIHDDGNPRCGKVFPPSVDTLLHGVQNPRTGLGVSEDTEVGVGHGGGRPIPWSPILVP